VTVHLNKGKAMGLCWSLLVSTVAFLATLSLVLIVASLIHELGHGLTCLGEVWPG
jgi:hypothetical protein